MGQAKRRANAWGRRVAAPLAYVPVETYWSVSVGYHPDLEDPGLIDYGMTAILPAARIHASVPSFLHPDRDPGTLAAMTFEKGDRLYLQIGEERGGVLLYDDHLRLPTEFDPERSMFFLSGYGHRVAFATGDPVEVALDADHGLFVTRTGPIEDLSFFADKMIVVDDVRGHFVGDALTLQATALSCGNRQDTPMPAIPEDRLIDILRHQNRFHEIIAGTKDAPKGTVVDPMVAAAILEAPETILSKTDGAALVETLALDALRLIRSVRVSD